jgi:hypothetical protein
MSIDVLAVTNEISGDVIEEKHLMEKFIYQRVTRERERGSFLGRVKEREREL